MQKIPKEFARCLFDREHEIYLLNARKVRLDIIETDRIFFNRNILEYHLKMMDWWIGSVASISSSHQLAVQCVSLLSSFFFLHLVPPVV